MIRFLRRSACFSALLVMLVFPLARRAAMQTTAPSCAQIPSGIVSWYPADENTAEENAIDIVSRNNGTLQNGATFAPGKVGTAFSLDGVDDIIEVPDRDSLDLNQLTIDAWINRTSTADARIVDKMTAGGTDGYALDIVNNHLRLIIGGATATGTTTLTTNAYVHVAGTFDGTILSVYVNGTLDGTTNVESATTPTNSLTLHIGSDSTGGGDLFAGQIDEVELFNRALAQNEIQPLVDADSTGKCRGAADGQLIITEFRFRGPGETPPPAGVAARVSRQSSVRASAQRGGGTSKPAYASDPNGYDEFIELYNNTNSDISVATIDGSAGWALVADRNLFTPANTVVTVIANGTIIPARAHYLVANTDGYSLNGYPAGSETTATPDKTYGEFDIPNDGGVALFNTANASHFSETTRLDAVGFAPPVVTGELRASGGKLSPKTTDPLFREGDGLPNPVNASVEHSFVRKATTGLPQDTGNNAADFQLVATDPVELAGAVLGAPGPENLSSPLMGLIKSALIEPCAAREDPPNRVRDGSDGVAEFGSLTLRRRFINFSSQPMTRLRFRIIDITTQPAPDADTADLRAMTSSTTSVQVMGAGCTGSAELPVQGLTLEEPPSQPNGGGLNSTLSAGTVTLRTPLMPGNSIDVQFLLGVQQTGNFRVFVILEQSFDTGTVVTAATVHAKQKFATGEHANTSGATTTTKGRGGAKSQITPRVHN
jgi:hypothetical protein